ncbi:S-methyl-5'-thioadenosine phosphorylase, partial [Geitlerinema sp. P-1104]|nr:S-methyl-5'-thioadenosine phosphorylase [Geitlerinema sp. P-1104]
MTDIAIGIIGGSGLYQMDDLENRQEHDLDTPFGPPSDVLISGTLQGVPVVFLARHGRNHHLLPSELPFRANIHAFKQLGVQYL